MDALDKNGILDSLKILRTIAETPATIGLEDAVQSGNVWRVGLALESGSNKYLFRIAK